MTFPSSRPLERDKKISHSSAQAFLDAFLSVGRGALQIFLGYAPVDDRLDGVRRGFPACLPPLDSRGCGGYAIPYSW